MFINGTFKNEFAVHFVPLKRIETAVDIVNKCRVMQFFMIRYADSSGYERFFSETKALIYTSVASFQPESAMFGRAILLRLT